jgi:hypothetical protein
VTRVLKTQNRPFSGWGVFEDKCRALGPQRLLVCLVRDIFLEMKKGSWRYFGNGLHNHQNHAFLSRVLLRLWLDTGEDQISLFEPWQDSDNAQVGEVLAEANDRYAQFLRERLSLDSNANKKSGQFVQWASVQTWFQALTSNPRSEDIYAELSRIWWLIRESWPRLQHTRGQDLDERLPLPMSTAFESIEHTLFLMMTVFLNNGYIKSPKDALRRTEIGDRVDTVLPLYFPDAINIVEDWDTLRRFPHEHFDTPFRKHPILKMPNGSLICPDPCLLFTALQDRIFDLILEDYGKENERWASSLMGLLFEEQICGRDT